MGGVDEADSDSINCVENKMRSSSEKTGELFFKSSARNEILLYYDIRRCCNGWKTKNI